MTYLNPRRTLPDVDAYRKRLPDLRQAIARVEQRHTVEAAHGSHGVTHYEDDAARSAESEWKTFASLAWLSGGKPSDSGHMSPWDAARHMWGTT